MIPKQDLKHGHYYKGTCRNAAIARWNGEEELFYHFRVKFGTTFIETINCPEDDDKYDVFTAEEDLTERHETLTLIPFN
jgi:hypothetical protein